MQMHPKTLQIYGNMERTATTSKRGHVSGCCEDSSNLICSFFLCQLEADRAYDIWQKIMLQIQVLSLQL